jgi:hypothetical protein
LALYFSNTVNKKSDYATSQYERVFRDIVKVESSARVNVMQEKMRISE